MKNCNIKLPNRFSESVVKLKNSRINYSSSHRNGQVSEHNILLMLMLVLQVIFLLPIRECTVVRYFLVIIKGLSFFNYQRPVTGFP